MKTKELIRLLQEEDPTGEVEVSVGNVDIHFLTTEPAYWDGSLQVLTRDKSKEPYYNITGGKYVRSGNKIVIHPLSIRDVLWNDPDTAVIDYTELGNRADQTREQDDKTRQAARDCEKQVEMDLFFRWAKKRAADVHPAEDFEDLKDVTDYFYDQNLSPNDPLKQLPPKPDNHGNMWHPSIGERRESGWDDTITIEWTGYWELNKKEAV
jgi:hypothetical protein